MKSLRLAVIATALLASFTLGGCDDKESASADSTAPAAQSSAPAPQAKPQAADLQKLAQQSAGKPLKLLDASEVQLDGASTLVLTFSVPLDPNQDFGRVVHLVDKKDGKVDGAWELAPNLKELRLRHLEPNRELVLSVDRELLALNKATFGIAYEKKYYHNILGKL
ncbi:MAG: alpha-2-macroglobulin, partial [Cronobacter sakazakii]|nr:alpha-2-macroglobulin [Cronobacter sakazakii]